jgi:hypothetical protein
MLVKARTWDSIEARLKDAHLNVDEITGTLVLFMRGTLLDISPTTPSVAVCVGADDEICGGGEGVCSLESSCTALACTSLER